MLYETIQSQRGHKDARRSWMDSCHDTWRPQAIQASDQKWQGDRSGKAQRESIARTPE